MQSLQSKSSYKNADSEKAKARVLESYLMHAHKEFTVMNIFHASQRGKVSVTLIDRPSLRTAAGCLSLTEFSTR